MEGRRWAIEDAFETAKNELGLAHNETRSRHGWHFVAVARHKSTLAAGRALGLSQSTVQRRLVELERRIGHQLVRRYQSGYRLTELGEANVFNQPIADLQHTKAVPPRGCSP